MICKQDTIKRYLGRAVLTPDGTMKIKFPHSAVLYLRHKETTPDTLKVQLERDDGTTVDLCDIAVVKTQKYAIDELFARRLFFLIPFYPFAHERNFDEYESDARKRGAFF